VDGERLVGNDLDVDGTGVGGAVGIAAGGGIGRVQRERVGAGDRRDDKKNESTESANREGIPPL
jgi:hypothetical protein